MKAKPRTKTVRLPKSVKTVYGLLTYIQKLIREEPKRYNQENWITHDAQFTARGLPACGTVGCVAGWMTALVYPKEVLNTQQVRAKAQDLLGPVPCYSLFNGGACAMTSPQTLRHARAGVRHIEAFKTDYADQLKALPLPEGR